MEGIDSRLTGTELDPTLLERGGGLVVDGGDDRRAVDEGDCRDGFMGDGQIPRRDSAVEGRKGWPLVGGGASWETTRSGR